MMRKTSLLLAIVCALVAHSSRAVASHGRIPQEPFPACAQLAPAIPALLADVDVTLIEAGEESASSFSFAASGPSAGALRTFESARNAALRQRAESRASAFGVSSSFAASAAQVLDSTAPGWGESRLEHLIRHRYFSPELGRFLQPDPMGYADSTSLYQGFNDNPSNYSDPLGLKDAPTTVTRLLDFGERLPLVGPAATQLKMSLRVWKKSVKYGEFKSRPPVRCTLQPRPQSPGQILFEEIKNVTPLGTHEQYRDAASWYEKVRIESIGSSGRSPEDQAEMAARLESADAEYYAALTSHGINMMGYVGMFAGGANKLFTEKPPLPPPPQATAPVLNRGVDYGSGLGRRGSFGTRAHLDAERDRFLDANPEYRHIGGGTDRVTGAKVSEEYIPGPGGARKGASYPDLTFEGPDGSRIRLNTVDTDPFGDMTLREQTNFDRIFDQTGEPIIAVPKPKK